VAIWTLERAKNQLSEVVRRALTHEPQLVTRGGHDAVVVLAKDDYEQLIAPDSLVSFLQKSPAADAVAAGELPEDAFDRRRELPRTVDI
jgi:prevent-host-death family protein